MKIVQYIYRHAFGENKRLGILLNENTVPKEFLYFWKKASSNKF